MKQSDARMRTLQWLVLSGVFFVSGGATCARREPLLQLPPPPTVLAQTASLTDVVAAVNRTAAIRELSTNTASVDVLSMPALPKLSATINLRKENEFRLKASLPIVMGSGLDMGSNDALFWFEVPDGMSRVLFYARHDLYRQQLDRAVLPVDPTWVTDALGLVQIDPNMVEQGPVMRADGKLEILSRIPLPAGTFKRVCYIDASAGHVTDQYLFAPGGTTPIAESHATNHRFYPEQNCALPHTVEFKLAPVSGESLAMRIDVGVYVINQLLSGDPNLFVIPQGASQAVDLTTLSPQGASYVVPTSYHVPVDYQPSSVGPMPYRGLVR